MQNVANVSPGVFQNLPADALTIKLRRNCVVTRSSLVVTYSGVEPASLFGLLPYKRRLELQLVGIGSIFKNKLSFFNAEDELFHVFNIWGSGYHHWLTEVAPKFFMFEDRIKRGRVLLPESTPAYVFDFLQQFGFQDYIQLTGNTFVKKLSIVSNPNSGHYKAEHILPVRERSLGEFANPTGDDPRRIYVSRANSRGRKVVNDDEVSEFLAERGFEIVHLDGMTFSDQVRMFSTCTVLVSIHGAALTNMLFMPPNAKVIEFYPLGFSIKDYFNACYFRLSSVLNLEHEYLFCRRENESKRFNLHWDDVIVDIKRLREALPANLVPVSAGRSH